MAKSVIPPKGDKVTATETKDITGKELLGTSPVGGPPDVSKQDASAKLSGVDDPQAVRERGPVEVDPKPFDVNNVQDSGTGTFVGDKPFDAHAAAAAAVGQPVGQFTGGELKNGDFSTRDALLHNDLNASNQGGNPTVNETAQAAVDAAGETPFLTLLDLDGRWAVRVQGVTIFLEPKSDFAGLPVPGMLQRVFGAINAAVSSQATTSTRKDSPTIARDDASRRSELDVALQKKKLEDSGVGT